MKKNSLIKVLGVLFFLVIILSWIIPIGTVSEGVFTSQGTSPLGIYDIFKMPVLSFATFISYAIYFFAIGGLYGVLNKTGVYNSVVNNIVKKWKGKEKKFLFIIIVLLALISSLTGLTTLLFVLIPFLGAILLLMGFPKVAVLASTVGSILVGGLASTYGFSGSGYVINTLGLSIHKDIFVKFILLAMVIVLFIAYISSKLNAKKAIKKEVKKDETSKKSLKSTKGAQKKEKVIEEKPVKEEKVVVPLFDGGSVSKKSSIPLVFLGVVFFIIAILGMFNWYYGFGIEIFNTLLDRINAFEIGGYPIFANILGSITGLGFWGTYDLVIWLILFTILIAWIYNVKLSDVVDGYKNGMKEMLGVAFYVMVACTIFTIALNLSDTSLFASMVARISLWTKGFNIFTTSLMTMLGSFFYNDFYYVLNDMGSVLSGYDANMLSTIGILVQSLYGLMMLFLPTSIFVVAGLSYFKVSYKEWMKYIWKFILEVFAIIIIVTAILVAFL